MDKIVDARFASLERSLTTLVESITKHNPTLAQARDLDAADSELFAALANVQRHQKNYLHIQELRAAAVAHDAQVRDTLTTLVATRKDVLSVPPPSGFADFREPASRYSVGYDQLLRYARLISRNTLPPPAIMDELLQPRPPGVDESQGSGAGAGGDGSSASQPMQQRTTPVVPQSPFAPPTPNGASTPSQPPPTQPLAQQTSQQTTQQTTASTSTSTTLPEGLAQHLNPLTGAVFHPWPSDDMIRFGGLAANQALVERGIDPRGYDPDEEAARKKREEQERREQEEKEAQERRQREQRAMEELQRIRREREAQGQGAGRGRSEAYNEFKFLNFEEDDDDSGHDDDDDDDDEYGL